MPLGKAPTLPSRLVADTPPSHHIPSPWGPTEHSSGEQLFNNMSFTAQCAPQPFTPPTPTPIGGSGAGNSITARWVLWEICLCVCQALSPVPNPCSLAPHCFPRLLQLGVCQQCTTGGIFLFEPNPAVSVTLRERVRAIVASVPSAAGRVHVVEAAVSNAVGQAVFKPNNADRPKSEYFDAATNQIGSLEPKLAAAQRM